ncbi:hypothetical protein DAEQUDRAFT_462960 [Daedalea quercina L-15889]|uniref:Uncharacterized protein n=1 Tax=Daedalea quercina L-15889 TaxID=1314783 RepID=A0A165TE41_9APHY|nr:hypothetical protein DAEQUDRAFT_462960 [Daedalea quercina L-15889]
MLRTRCLEGFQAIVRYIGVTWWKISFPPGISRLARLASGPWRSRDCSDNVDKRSTYARKRTTGAKQRLRSRGSTYTKFPDRECKVATRSPHPSSRSGRGSSPLF